jgi:hypothetical protein
MTAPADSSSTAAAKPRHQWIGGLLPYIGVILFAIAVIWNAVTGNLTGHRVLDDGITYLIGWAGLGAGISHIVFGARIAKTIGFRANDFQTEVGFANLGMGVAGLMSQTVHAEFALALIVINSIFRIGAGLVHIRSAVRDRNFAVNNTAILGVDFLVPVFLICAYLAWA